MNSQILTFFSIHFFEKKQQQHQDHGNNSIKLLAAILSFLMFTIPINLFIFSHAQQHLLFHLWRSAHFSFSDATILLGWPPNRSSHSPNIRWRFTRRRQDHISSVLHNWPPNRHFHRETRRRRRRCHGFPRIIFIRLTCAELNR